MLIHCSLASKERRWGLKLSPVIDLLPKRVSGPQLPPNPATGPKGDSQTSLPNVKDSDHIYSETFTPMSPQEPPSFANTALVIPVPIDDTPESPVRTVNSPAVASCDMELETSFDSAGPSSPEKGKDEPVKKPISRGCDTVTVPLVPSVPDIYAPNSLDLSEKISRTMTMQHNLQSSTSTGLLGAPEPQPTHPDYNEWRRRKDQERMALLQRQQPTSHSRTPPNNGDIPQKADTHHPPNPIVVEEEDKGEDEHVKLFSPASPDESPMAPLRSSSRDPSQEREEEEGEILDDEDWEIEDEMNTSSDLDQSSSMDESIKPKKSTITNARSHHKPIQIPSSPPRKRSRHSSSRRLSVNKSKKRRKHSADVDYRDRGQPEDASLSSTLKESGVCIPNTNQFKDTDYRYQVYIPKSAETTSVPVKVINYDYQTESGVSQNYGRSSSSQFTASSSSSSHPSRNRCHTRQPTSQRALLDVTPSLLPGPIRSPATQGTYHTFGNGAALLPSVRPLLSSTGQIRPLMSIHVGGFPTALSAPFSPVRFRLQPPRPRAQLIGPRSDSVMAALVDSTTSGSSSGV